MNKITQIAICRAAASQREGDMTKHPAWLAEGPNLATRLANLRGVISYVGNEKYSLR